MSTNPRPSHPEAPVSPLATPTRFAGELAWQSATAFVEAQCRRGRLTEQEAEAIRERLAVRFNPVTRVEKNGSTT